LLPHLGIEGKPVNEHHRRALAAMVPVGDLVAVEVEIRHRHCLPVDGKNDLKGAAGAQDSRGRLRT
jgi:hypothetical protein